MFYHLTYIDDLVAGLRLCATVPTAAGRTYLLAGPEYTTLNQLVGADRARAGRQAAGYSFSGVAGVAGWRGCARDCLPLRIDPPLFRRRVDFYRKSRAFSTARARRELGYNPAVDLEDRYRPHGRVVPFRGVALTVPSCRANSLFPCAS